MSFPKVKLANGVEMPQIGLGVYQVSDHEVCKQSCLDALKAGYRHIDTAAAYCNEEAVGKAIKESGVPRNEIFITSKVFICDFGYEKAKKSVERTLRLLQTDYIDLMLIHQPYGDYIGTWKALEECYKAGKIKSIGVSNFYDGKFMDIMLNDEDFKIKPMVNQIELHPFYQRNVEFEIGKQYNCAIEAWGSLMEAKKELMENEVIKAIAEKHKKSVAQILLRWGIEKGAIIIPKSVHKERIEENMKIFDFKLDEDDMNKIKPLDGKMHPICKHDENATTKLVFNFAKKVMDYYKTHP